MRPLLRKARTLLSVYNALMVEVRSEIFLWMLATAFPLILMGVWIKAGDGAQAALIESDPERFYRPKYVGPSGWIGVRLERDVDWAQVRELLVLGYREVAPKRALAQLDQGR